MARSRTHLDSEVELRPKHLAKQEFAKRVYRLMVEKGWHQAELARQAGLPRDSVSVYIRGKSLPTPRSLRKIAEALDVDPDDLLPNYIEGAIDEDEPAFELRASTNAPNVAWLRVNRLVKMSTAAQIVTLLEADDAKASTDGK